ncbi:hypothetical protein LEP1GSC188_3408 [Leptospira weilii serovar Topaz str. LT2116]|uniref:Phage neck terminator protein gp12-like domain-containing protein n=1 Tax=Leptospira weilii serovar Topaz str. LT2116 TaxID=1088540 RepID=M3H0G7_9LEPT|nr:hypothetical protein LEP1GSC188_3408 [Leptospira weilii serovar Topaz str. LT2116]
MADTSPSVLRKLMRALDTHLETLVIRKNQDGPRPDYPYCAYGVLVRKKDAANLRYPKPNEDPTKISMGHFIPEEVKVSLSFYNANAENPLDVLYELSTKAREWLEIHGKDAIEKIGVVIDDFSTLQDRTTLLDVVYEYQLGFDFRIRGFREAELVLDAVDLESTFNSIDWENE